MHVCTTHTFVPVAVHNLKSTADSTCGAMEQWGFTAHERLHVNYRLRSCKFKPQGAAAKVQCYLNGDLHMGKRELLATARAAAVRTQRHRSLASQPGSKSLLCKQGLQPLYKANACKCM